VRLVCCAIWLALMSLFTKKREMLFLLLFDLVKIWLEHFHRALSARWMGKKKSGCRNFVVGIFIFYFGRGLSGYVLFVFVCVVSRLFNEDDTSPKRNKWRVKSNCTGHTTTTTTTTRGSIYSEANGTGVLRKHKKKRNCDRRASLPIVSFFFLSIPLDFFFPSTYIPPICRALILSFRIDFYLVKYSDVCCRLCVCSPVPNAPDGRRPIVTAPKTDRAVASPRTRTIYRPSFV
jgi:hypothetical protein